MLIVYYSVTLHVFDKVVTLQYNLVKVLYLYRYNTVTLI